MQKHRVVFELSVDGADQWNGMLNNAESLQKIFGGKNCEIEVVAHGKGLGLILETNRAMLVRLQKLSSAGVIFAACENTMRRLTLTREDLMALPRVRKQEDAWSYIKSVT